MVLTWFCFLSLFKSIESGYSPTGLDRTYEQNLLHRNLLLNSDRPYQRFPKFQPRLNLLIVTDLSSGLRNGQIICPFRLADQGFNMLNSNASFDLIFMLSKGRLYFSTRILVRHCLISKKNSIVPVTSNLWTYAGSIKCC